MGCHPERSERSVPQGTEMLPLRCAQGFGSRAQHDKTELVKSYNRRCALKTGAYRTFFLSSNEWQ
jgi:hypothetical protein